MRYLLVVVCFFFFGKLSGTEKFVDKYKRDYFVQLPENFDPDKKYWLFVLVHGHRGNGEKTIGGYRKYAFAQTECITVAPSFPWDPKMGGYYQTLGGNSDKQLISIFQTLGKKYKLHDRMLLYGFSGGSQFTHRFAMKHHKYVLACSSHSGGSWGKVSSSAGYIPFAISCGEMDTKKSVSSSPMGRLEWYRSFRKDMLKSKMFFTDSVRAGEGHGGGPWTRSSTETLFQLASTGLFPSQLEVFEKELSKIKNLSDPKQKQMQLSRLRSFQAPKLKYTKQNVNDTDLKLAGKTQKSANEYGFTTSSKAERYLKERFQYYLKEIVTPKLLK